MTSRYSTNFLLYYLNKSDKVNTASNINKTNLASSNSSSINIFNEIDILTIRE